MGYGRRKPERSKTPRKHFEPRSDVATPDRGHQPRIVNITSFGMIQDSFFSANNEFEVALGEMKLACRANEEIERDHDMKDENGDKS